METHPVRREDSLLWATNAETDVEFQCTSREGYMPGQVSRVAIVGHGDGCDGLR